MASGRAQVSAVRRIVGCLAAAGAFAASTGIASGGLFAIEARLSIPDHRADQTCDLRLELKNRAGRTLDRLTFDISAHDLNGGAIGSHTVTFAYVDGGAAGRISVTIANRCGEVGEIKIRHELACRIGGESFVKCMDQAALSTARGTGGSVRLTR